jgi:hypothetical protein
MVVTVVNNYNELSYIYYLFTAVGLSEGSSEAVCRRLQRLRDSDTAIRHYIHLNRKEEHMM